MKLEMTYRKADISDKAKLSVLFSQVYIQTYGNDGISDESADYILKQFSCERIESLIRNNTCSILVAESDGNLTGAAEIIYDSICPAGDFIAPEICKLYVLQNFTGKGIGFRLISEAEKAVKESGYNQIWLTVYYLNDRAISFYKRQGYNHIGDFEFQMKYNSYLNRVMMKNIL